MTGRTRQHWWAAAILAAVIVIAFGDIVFFGRTLLASNMQSGTMPSGTHGYEGGAYAYTGRRIESYPIIDYVSAWTYEPYVKVLHDDIARHWLPLWDPYVGSGAPLLANMAPAALSPMRLALAAIDNPVFWDFYLLLRLFIAAFFMYLFSRDVGIGFTGSLVSAIAFGLCGHFIYYINMPDLDAQIWLPALLLATHKLAEKPTYGKFGITAGLVALIILAGMPESALYIFLLATSYLFFRLGKFAPPERPEKLSWRRPFVAFVGAGAAGLLVSLPQVLPFVELLQNAFNPRAPGVGMRQVSAGTAVSLIVPNFFGHVHDTWNGIDSNRILPYIGAGCWLLALVGMCREGKRPRLSWFLAGFAIFYLLKALGIPPVQWVGRLPLFSMSLFPKHAFPEFSFCMAMLAGMGAENLLKNEVNYSRFLFVTISVAVTVMAFAGYYWNEAGYFGGLQDVTESCLIFDLTFGLVWLVALAARRFAPSRAIAIALVLLPAAELIGFIPRERAERYDGFTKPPFVDFLRGDRELYRTFSVDNVLFPNTNSAYGIDDIRSLDPLQVSRYRDFLRAEFNPSIYDRFDASEVSRDIVRSPLLDLMNVKYILASSELAGHGVTSDKFELVYDREIRIYRNKNALPRAFVVGHAEVIPGKKQILAKLSEPGFDARKTVILEENITNKGAMASAANSAVTFERYEPNYIRLQAELTHPGWLVLSDTYYPGWKVLVDGRAGRILPADYIFRAVRLESGSHVVEFVYRPASFVWGVTISLLTMAILILIPLSPSWVRSEKTPERKLGYLGLPIR
jgi:Bacterial membrane protein YfhO